MVVPLDGGAPRGIADAGVPSTFPASALVEPEPVTIRAEGGAPLRGQLFKSAQGPARRPAVLFVHGGPAQQMLLGWHYLEYYAHAYAINQYLAQRGFVVMSVNYRLGIGYGHAFQYPDETGRGETPEYDDVLAAAKYLQARSDVDPLRIGVWGGSYGGYLAGLGLIRNSDVFAAGVDIHGVHDRLIRELEATVFPTLEDMSDPNPTWSSPVLLIHGDDDRTVPFQQTVDLESRLRDKGVTVEVLTIPDDLHDFLLFRSWESVAAATAAYLERTLMNRPN
jgi:dipeptidyl aminopeptidase/acylaminoacyl peptidase